MLKIRLARMGKKKKPTYRFIVSESARDPYGRALEILGHYNPFSKVTEVKKDRILYWISKGAQVSPTVHNLLIDQNVLEGDKVRASKSKKKKKGGEADKPAIGEAKPEGDAGAKKAEEPKAEEVKKEDKPAESDSKPAKEIKPEEQKKEEKPVELKEDVKSEEPKKGELKGEEKAEEVSKESSKKED